MKVSEIQESDLQDYLKLEFNDPLIGIFLESAKSYVKSYTGMTDEQMDSYDDIVAAIYVLVSDMYDNRMYAQKNTKVTIAPNIVAKSILDMHSHNLL